MIGIYNLKARYPLFVLMLHALIFSCVALLLSCESNSGSKLKKDSSNLSVDLKDQVEKLAKHSDLYMFQNPEALEYGLPQDIFSFYSKSNLTKLKESIRQTPDSSRLKRIVLLIKISTFERSLGLNDESVLRLKEAIKLHDELLKDDVPVPGYILGDLYYQLAISFLRIGESRNCISKHSEESCIFPLKGRAVHQDTSGSTKAIEYLLKILANVN